MIITCPTPQRAPTLDKLHAIGVDMFVLYLHPGGRKHGWGEIALNHPHRIARTSWEAVAVTAMLFWSRRVSLFASFGYREPGNAVGLLLARFTKTPIVIRSDSNLDGLANDPAWKRTARRLLIRTLIPRRSRVWSIGTKNEQYWASEGGFSSFERIPYEVPRLPGDAVPRTRDSTAHGVLRILYVGRLAPEKRVSDIIHATAGLDEVGIRWTLKIVGKGPDETELRAQSAHDPRIQFVGSVPYDALADYYQAADVLVLPSGYEPWGLTVNEGLGFGLWTICSSAVGAGHDLLTPEGGAVYRVGDVAALTLELIHSMEHRRQAPRSVRTDTAALMAESIRRHRRRAFQ